MGGAQNSPLRRNAFVAKNFCVKLRIPKGLLPVLAFLFALALPLNGALTLASQGMSRYRIVVATNALPSEQYAAEELQRYLEKLSGAQLPIVTDSTPVSSGEILLGDNAHTRRLGLNIDFARLGAEDFTIRTEQDRLVIAGGKPRGTLYGVYTLLEEKLGVRWFTPEVETAIRTNRLLLSELNETRIPPLEYREVFWTEMTRNADFAARHRLNGDHYHLTAKHGGAAVVYFPFVHSMDELIPQALYAEHPEYFPLIGGKRVNGYVQRCLSNPDVVKLAIAQVRRWLKEHPDATIISVSQNDTGKWCQCETCNALDDAEGSPSASLLRFVNTIAAHIEGDYPNIRIDTLAYQYTRKPPKTLRPRSNVIIRLCSIECCFAHPLATCSSRENERFRSDIVAWQPVARRLYVWDYTTDFGHYQQPFPNFDVLQPNVQFFVEHGVKGLFEQGNYSGGGNGELEPLRAYLLAKVLWNPKTDLQQHTREFCASYYGHSAPRLLDYVELLENQVQSKPVHAHIFDSTKAAYLNENFIFSGDKLLEDAESLAENDTVRERVRVARLPIWYVQLATNRVAGQQRTDLLHQFLQVARHAGMSHISESQSLDDWAKKMGAD